jgi:hypothetical protein
MAAAAAPDYTVHVVPLAAAGVPSGWYVRTHAGGYHCIAILELGATRAQQLCAAPAAADWPIHADSLFWFCAECRVCGKPSGLSLHKNRHGENVVAGANRLLAAAAVRGARARAILFAFAARATKRRKKV